MVAKRQLFVKQAKTLFEYKTDVSETAYVWSLKVLLTQAKKLISSFSFYPMISWRLVTFQFSGKKWCHVQVYATRSITLGWLHRDWLAGLREAQNFCFRNVSKNDWFKKVVSLCASKIRLYDVLKTITCRWVPNRIMEKVAN